MKKKFIGLSEKTKFKLLLIATFVGLCCLVIFIFKLPTTSDYKQDSYDSDLETTSIVDGVVYEQKFHSKVKSLHSISLLMLNESVTPLSGEIILESYNEKDELIGVISHSVKNISSISFVPNAMDIQPDSYDKTYMIKFYSKGIGSDTKLKLAIKKTDLEDDSLHVDGIDSDDKAIVSYSGRKGNKTFYWMIGMYLLLLVPLYATLDYSKIKKKEG